MFSTQLVFFTNLNVNRPLTMKKDGIQTRNRKLSSKGKKKKGLLPITEVPHLKPLDPSKPFCSFAPTHGHLSSAMSSMSAMSAVNHYVHGAGNMPLGMGGSHFMSSHTGQWTDSGFNGSRRIGFAFHE